MSSRDDGELVTFVYITSYISILAGERGDGDVYHGLYTVQIGSFKNTAVTPC